MNTDPDKKPDDELESIIIATLIVISGVMTISAAIFGNL